MQPPPLTLKNTEENRCGTRKTAERKREPPKKKKVCWREEEETATERERLPKGKREPPKKEKACRREKKNGSGTRKAAGGEKENRRRKRKFAGGKRRRQQRDKKRPPEKKKRTAEKRESRQVGRQSRHGPRKECKKSGRKPVSQLSKRTKTALSGTCRSGKVLLSLCRFTETVPIWPKHSIYS